MLQNVFQQAASFRRDAVNVSQMVDAMRQPLRFAANSVAGLIRQPPRRGYPDRAPRQRTPELHRVRLMPAMVAVIASVHAAMIG